MAQSTTESPALRYNRLTAGHSGTGVHRRASDYGARGRLAPFKTCKSSLQSELIRSNRDIGVAMKRIIIVILLILLSEISYSAPRNVIGGDFVKKPGMFKQMDKHALNTPAWAEKDIETLVKYLIKPAKSELDKARVIWRWITDNITYSTGNSYMSAKGTFENRNGICSGYANLYTKMGRLAGLTVENIQGSSKGYILRPGAFTSGQLHAWNGVRIDGRWYLLDATWGAGNKNHSKYMEYYSEYYFLTKPTQLIFSHLPDSSRWQILKKPVGILQFNQWPKVLPFFFLNEMKPLSHYIAVYYVKSKDSVKLEVPTNVEIIAHLLQKGKHSRYKPLVKRTGKTVTIDLKFKHTGVYTLHVIGRKKGSKNYYNAIQYSFISGRDREEVIIHDTGKNQLVEVHYPKYKKIRAKKEILFNYNYIYGETIQVKNAGKTHIIKGNQAGRFEKRIWIKPGKVEVYMKNRDEDFFRLLAVYEAD